MFEFQRAGESTSLVAEQFAFQQCFRDGGAIDPNIGRFFPRTQAVKRTRDKFLARAAFAEDERTSIGGCDGLDELA